MNLVKMVEEEEEADLLLDGYYRRRRGPDWKKDSDYE